MKVMAISDLHGFLPEKYKDIDMDVLCICGDISPLNIQLDEGLVYQWIKSHFIPWVDSLKCKKCFLVAGNHDFIFYHNRNNLLSKLFDGTKVEYLQDKLSSFTFEDKTIKVYGTPWCHIFYNWAFMIDDYSLHKKFSKIPDHIDILMTHDVPYNTCDVILEKRFYTGEHIGCIPLKENIVGKDIKYVLCGHLHTTSHEPFYLGDTIVKQCSVVNEWYHLTYEPYIFEL